MAIKPLAELEDYRLSSEEQDCRAWMVEDTAGNFFGTVEEMLVDTDSEMVTALVLDSGEQIPAHAVSLADGRVIIDKTDDSTGEERNIVAAEAGEEITLPVIEEQIRIGKKVAETGGLRISTRVTEKPVEETVMLREETLNVERRSVDRPATEEDLAQISGAVVEIPKMVEQPVVAKQPVIAEEIVIGKEVTARDETVKDTVKRTEVEVEELDSEKSERKAAP